MGSLPVPLVLAREQYDLIRDLACVRAGGAAWPQETPGAVPYYVPPAVPRPSGIPNFFAWQPEFGPAGANGYKCLEGQIALGRETAARRIKVGPGAAGLAQCRTRCEGSPGCLGFNLSYGGAGQRGGSCVAMLSIHSVEPSAPATPNSATGTYCNRLAGAAPAAPSRFRTDPQSPRIEPGQPRPAAPAPSGKK
jgi:hypothetical protein